MTLIFPQGVWTSPLIDEHNIDHNNNYYKFYISFRWTVKFPMWKSFPYFLRLSTQNSSSIQDRCSTYHLSTGIMLGRWTSVFLSVFGGIRKTQTLILYSQIILERAYELSTLYQVRATIWCAIIEIKILKLVNRSMIGRRCLINSAQR